MSASSPEEVLRLRAIRHLDRLHGVAASEPPDQRQARRRQYQRDWERRKREETGIKPAEPAVCGTRSGYNSHLAQRRFAQIVREVAVERGYQTIGLADPETLGPCDKCLQANATYQRQRRAETRAWQLAHAYVEMLPVDPEAARRIYDDLVAHANKADSDKARRAVEFADGRAD